MRLKNIAYLFIIGLAIASIWACNKTGDNVPATPPVAYLNVVDMVTDIRGIDFYLSGTRQNTNSAIYLYNSSGYTAVTAGSQQYQFKSDTDRTLLADLQLNTGKADSAYTVVLAGQQGTNTISPIFIGDQFLIDTVSTHAIVRLVQASPGTQSYDFFVGDTLSFKNKAYKAYTGFQGVGAGKKNVKVTLAGTNTVVFSGTAIIQPRGYYTFFTKGTLNGTGNNAFGVSVNLSK